MIYLFQWKCHLLSDLSVFCIQQNDFLGELDLTALRSEINLCQYHVVTCCSYICVHVKAGEEERRKVVLNI